MTKRKRRVTSATRERLRKMRQKYGLGEYKKYMLKKSHGSKRAKHVGRDVSVMARRRKSYAPVRHSRRGGFRKAAHSKGASELALIGYAVVGENLFDSITKNFNMGISPRILKIGAGYFLKKKSGLVGQLGTAMYTVELYKLGKDIASGGLNLGNLFGIGTQSAAPSANGAQGASW